MNLTKNFKQENSFVAIDNIQQRISQHENRVNSDRKALVVHC